MKYSWYCENCFTPLSKWEQLVWHRMYGHVVSDYDWPKKQSEKNVAAVVLAFLLCFSLAPRSYAINPEDGMAAAAQANDRAEELQKQIDEMKVEREVQRIREHDQEESDRMDKLMHSPGTQVEIDKARCAQGETGHCQ